MSGRARQVALLVATAALLAGLVVGVHRASPRSLVSAHGLLHSAIALRMADGAAPPENPFFAGRPLPYYWVFQWLGAQLGGALGIDPLHAFELCILLAIAALVAGAAALGGSLYGAPAAGALIAWLVFAGANVQAPLVLGARLARHGAGLLADDPSYLWGLVHPVSRQMRLGDPFGMYGPLIPFFLNITARPLALAALVVTVAALHRAWRGPSASTLLGVVAAGAALGALGSLVALAATGALAAGLALTARRGAAAGRTRVGVSIGALALGVLAAAPTYVQLFRVAGGETALLGDGLGGALARAGTLLASAWLPALLAGVGVRRAPAATRPFLSALLIAAAVLCAANVLLRLPSGNEDNFFHAALALLAVPAAASALASDSPVCRLDPKRAAALALVFAPTAALVVATYLGRPPVPIAFDGERLLRTPADSDLARLYAWIRAETPHDAVFVIDPGPPIRAFAGNSAELPAFTARAIWTERATHYLVKPNADAEARLRVVRALVQGAAPAPADEALVVDLARSGRTLYVVPDATPDAARDARLSARFGAPVFRSGGQAVWRWRGPDALGDPETLP